MLSICVAWGFKVRFERFYQNWRVYGLGFRATGFEFTGVHLSVGVLDSGADAVFMGLIQGLKLM